jgi:hypothetical protein
MEKGQDPHPKLKDKIEYTLGDEALNEGHKK